MRAFGMLPFPAEALTVPAGILPLALLRPCPVILSLWESWQAENKRGAVLADGVLRLLKPQHLLP